MMTATDYWNFVIVTVNIVVFLYFIVVNVTYLMLFTSAFFYELRYVRRKKIVDLDEIFRSPLTPLVSVIIPAYNESATIVEVVTAALHLRYPRHEVVVVNDGSTDRTLDDLVREFGLRMVTWAIDDILPSAGVAGVYISPRYDNLLVIDKHHGGKSDSLNAGINAARGSIVCTVDADSIMVGDALLNIVRPFLEHPDRTVAAGGMIRVVNGSVVSGGRVKRVRLPRSWWANLQVIEYLRAFLGARLGWSTINALLIVPGAFGAFRRSVLIEVGGYSVNTVGEDMDLVLRLHKLMRRDKRPYRIVFIPDPVCWTRAPEGYVSVSRQRDRWQRGLIESMRGSEEMLFNPRYGAAGMLAYPFYFFFEMLGPVVELLGYVMVVLAQVYGLLEKSFLILFLVVAVLYGIIVSLYGIILDGIALGRFPRLPALAKMSFFAVLDNVGYRQLNTWWRVKAYFTVALRRNRWGRREERGRARERLTVEG